MTYKERKTMMDAMDPDKLAGKTPKDAPVAEAYFRWHLLQLLADIADHQDNMSYAYKEMLKMQQAKRNGAPAPAPVGKQ